MTPAEIQARVLYRDGLCLIIDKPAGLACHAGPGGGDNLERYFEHLRFGLPRPPSLAHRLDRDTSGCLALGRHPKALRRLGKLFQEGRVRKTYWAIALGKPATPRGKIELPLAKAGDKRGWRMEVSDAGQASATEYQVLGEVGGLSWIAFHPLTGRTHQIRVHAATIGCPLLGDALYGGRARRFTCTQGSWSCRFTRQNRPSLLLHRCPPPCYRAFSAWVSKASKINEIGGKPKLAV